MRQFADWILARLSENSTWRGLILFATSLGVSLTPEFQNQIIAAGLGLVGLINMVRKGDKGLNQ